MMILIKKDLIGILLKSFSQIFVQLLKNQLVIVHEEGFGIR